MKNGPILDLHPRREGDAAYSYLSCLRPRRVSLAAHGNAWSIPSQVWPLSYAPTYRCQMECRGRRFERRKISRVALGVTSQGSHRSGRAQLTHPARLVAVSRALCYPWSFRGQWIGVQCPRTVARARFRDKAPPSLHRLLAARVPRLLWYYGVLRFPYALPAALRFLRATVTIPCACVRLSIQVRRGGQRHPDVRDRRRELGIHL